MLNGSRKDVEYKRREFCKEIKSLNSEEVENQTVGSGLRSITQEMYHPCIYVTNQFHKWLIEKGYLILKPKASRSNDYAVGNEKPLK